jgi:hypothetical protein
MQALPLNSHGILLSACGVRGGEVTSCSVRVRCDFSVGLGTWHLSSIMYQSLADASYMLCPALPDPDNSKKTSQGHPPPSQHSSVVLKTSLLCHAVMCWFVSGPLGSEQTREPRGRAPWGRLSPSGACSGNSSERRDSLYSLVN